MILSYSKLIGKNVSELKDQQMLGKIHELIYDNANFSVTGIIVNQGNFLSNKQSVVAAIDFVKLNNDGLIVLSDDVLNDLSDLVRVNQLYKEKYFGLSQKVTTLSDQSVGKVFDLTFDAETGAILKIYVKNMFREQIIPVAKIVSWEGKNIKIKDDKLPNFLPTTEVVAE